MFTASRAMLGAGSGGDLDDKKQRRSRRSRALGAIDYASLARNIIADAAVGMAGHIDPLKNRGRKRKGPQPTA